MSTEIAPLFEMSGQIGRNVLVFIRLLRVAGLAVGSDRALCALEALALVGVTRRDDVHATLSGVLIDAPEQQPVFDALFEAVWNPGWLERTLLGSAGPSLPGAASRSAPHMPETGASAGDDAALKWADNQRVAQALANLRRQAEVSAAEPHRTSHREGGFTADEQFRQADFRSMSSDEFAAATRLAARLARSLPELRTRRNRASRRGRIDLRASLRRTARSPFALEPAYSEPRTRPEALILLCDVSGSMQRYARLMLHWAHAITVADSRTETLTLGTRLTRISRKLRHRDPDEAIRITLSEIVDWGGGTRLGTCIERFNRDWARRLLGNRATVLLLTDGLDREGAELLAREAARLRRYARRVIWLNPLLRFEGFEPRAAGIRALMPSVDAMLPVHNLASLEKLPEALT
jgi:uncharacterized protein with von Willebrand factor type A (vWA) domain